MEYSQYVRKPFPVKGVLITKENIAEIAELTGKLETKDDGTIYIEVDKNKVPNVNNIYVGFYLTKMDKQLRCYPPQIFGKLFVDSDPELEAFVKELNGRTLIKE